jgi:hypothetical protein
MIETTYLPSARILALPAFVCVVPFLVIFAVARGVWWAEYLGVKIRQAAGELPYAHRNPT